MVLRQESTPNRIHSRWKISDPQGWVNSKANALGKRFFWIGAASFLLGNKLIHRVFLSKGYNWKVYHFQFHEKHRQTYRKLQIKRFLIDVLQGWYISSFGYALSKGGNFCAVDSKKERARSHPGFAAERERTEKENIVWWKVKKEGTEKQLVRRSGAGKLTWRKKSVKSRLMAFLLLAFSLSLG